MLRSIYPREVLIYRSILAELSLCKAPIIAASTALINTLAPLRLRPECSIYALLKILYIIICLLFSSEHYFEGVYSRRILFFKVSVIKLGRRPGS